MPYNKPDLVLIDPARRVHMVVEVKGHELTLEQKDRLVRQVRAYQDQVGADYGLLFTPGVSLLIHPEGVNEFDGAAILRAYGIGEELGLNRHQLVEDVAYNWLVDLSMGLARPGVPLTLPDLDGDEVLRAA